MGLKGTLSLGIQSMKVHHQPTERVSKYANIRVESITTLNLPECKLFLQSNVVAKAPKIPQTFPVHKVIRHMSKNVIVCLQFFNLSSDQKFFFTQYHQKEGDPEICGHEGMNVKANVILQNLDKLRMVRIGLAVFSAGFTFTKIPFMLSLIISVFC